MLNQATSHCPWRSPAGHPGTTSCRVSGYRPKHGAFWKWSSYQGCTKELGLDTQQNMRTGEYQTRVILRKGRLTPYCQRYPQGGVSGEVCQTRNIASNPAVAGLDLTVSNTQCKDQTEKVHPCRSPPAASGTSQGTHVEIHST